MSEEGITISKRLALINAASSILAKVLTVAVLFWLHPFLLHRIGTEEYQLLPIVMAVVAWLPLVTSVLTGGIGRYVVEACAKGDTRRMAQIVTTMFPLVTGVALLIAAGAFILAWKVDSVLVIAPTYVPEARAMVLMVLLSFAFRLSLMPFSVGLYVRQKFVLRNGIECGKLLLRIALMLVLFLLLETRVIWVVVANTAATVCEVLLLFVISRRLVPSLRCRRGHWNSGILKIVTSFGIWNFLGACGDAIRRCMDPVILNRLASSLDVTCFHLGSLFRTHTGVAITLAFSPLQPALIAMHAAGSLERLKNAYLRGCRYALLIAVFVALPLVIFRREIILLWLGEKFLTASIVIMLLMVELVITYANYMFSGIAFAKARIKLMSVCILVSQIMHVGLTLYFVGVLRMGAVGSALATGIMAAVFQLFIFWPMAIRMTGVTMRQVLTVIFEPVLISGSTAGIVWVALRALLPVSSWVVLGGCVIAGMIAYIVSFLLVGINDVERAELRRALGVVWARLSRKGSG